VVQCDIRDIEFPAASVRHVEPLNVARHVLVVVASNGDMGLCRLIVDALERVHVRANETVLESFINEASLHVIVLNDWVGSKANNGGHIAETFEGWVPLGFVLIKLLVD